MMMMGSIESLYNTLKTDILACIYHTENRWIFDT
jgi:hypothetical protein